MSDVYEWRRFEVGERVRVRLSPECQFWIHKDFNIVGHDCTDGSGAKVCDVRDHALYPDGHRLYVEYEPPVPCVNRANTVHHASMYAAAELEPIEAES